MISFARHRRAIVAAVLVVSAFSVAIGRAVVEGTLEAQDATGRGYVLGASAGERLIRNGGDLFIKVDPRNGSRALALGTQQVPIGTGIRVHRHATMDEVFYVLSGTGLFVLNEARQAVQPGATIFIPRGAWHGFENPGSELVLVWAVAPPGLEGLFREVATPPGVAPTALTLEQLNTIARKYGTEFR
jgi:quercetin dioxygenase-like cupin family protein